MECKYDIKKKQFKPVIKEIIFLQNVTVKIRKKFETTYLFILIVLVSKNDKENTLLMSLNLIKKNNLLI
jgi:hypothetical protein